MDRLLLLCVIYLMQVAVCFSNEEKIQEFHQGRFTRDIPKDKSTIVYPRKVDHAGEFVSHLLPHHYKRSYYYAKRHAGLGNYTLEDQVHYRIPIDGEEHHLELEPNHALLSPGSVIETRGDFDDVRIKRAKDSQCHYHGKVRGHDSSRTALSTCYGLAGFVRTKRGYYIIEPVKDHDHETGKEHAHVMYKLDPDEILEPNCRTKGLIHTLAERAVRESKRAFQTKGSSAKDVNANLFIETLVVLDKPFLTFHKSYDVENYALTVMNMVYNIYRDASFGAMAEVSIVRMVRLEQEKDEMNLGVNKDAETTLTNFCNWQKKTNPGDDSHPNHHDVAVLLTRVDICYDNTECGLLGLAKMGGCCDPKIACAINEDNGLILGYTIAHEMGHTLGIEHDEPPGTTCTGFMPDGTWHTVMNPSINSFTGEWSTCSQSYFKVFMDAGFGSCLLDKPSDHDFKIIDILPGVMYGATFQCKELINQDSFVCEMGITCDSLNCRTAESVCMETHEPPVPGTSCGEKKWCYKQKCLTIGQRPGAVNGGWGAWGPWSACSRTCGAGVTSTERKCDKPRPAHGGKYCVGERKRHKICSTEPCAVGQPSFRDVQCAEFNDWTYPETKKKHKWKGIFLPGENPCALACLNEERTVATLKPQVTDGTTCHRGLRDICIGGACREIPCDLDLESKAVEDQCGICHGNGKGCTVKRGTNSFKKNMKKMSTLVEVPSGTRNIRVQEVEPTRAHIVVKQGKKVLVNGDKLGMFQVPGSKAWLGMIHESQEALNIPGPVSAALTIQVRCLADVKMDWSMATKSSKKRRDDSAAAASYSWDWIDWTECSAQCGPGLEMSIPKCVEQEAGLVEDLYCHDKEKPDDKERPCYLEPCSPRWMIGDWSAECDKGKRYREVKCVKPAGEGEGESDIIDDAECKGAKPESEEDCKSGRTNALGEGEGGNCALMSRQDLYREHEPLVPPSRNYPESFTWTHNSHDPLGRDRLVLEKDFEPEKLVPAIGFWEQHIQPEQPDKENTFWEQHVPLEKEYHGSGPWPVPNNELDGNYKARITLQKRSVEQSTADKKPSNVAETPDFLFSPDALNQRRALKQKNSDKESSVQERSIKQRGKPFNNKMKRSVEMRNQGHQSTEFLDNDLRLKEYLDASKLDLGNFESEYVGASGEAAFDNGEESNEQRRAVRVSRLADKQGNAARNKIHRRSSTYLGDDLTEYEEGPKVVKKRVVHLLNKGDSSFAKVTGSNGVDAQVRSDLDSVKSQQDINRLYKRSLLERRYLFTDRKNKSPYESINTHCNNKQHSHLCKNNWQNGPSLDEDTNEQGANVADITSKLSSIDANDEEHPLSLLDLEMEREFEDKLKNRFAASRSGMSGGPQQNSPMIGTHRELGVMPPSSMDQTIDLNSRRRRSTKSTDNKARQFLSAQFYDIDVMPIVSVDEAGKLMEESISFNDMDDTIDEVDQFENEERRAKRQNTPNVHSPPVRQDQTRSVNSAEAPTIATKKLELMIPIEVDLLSSQDASHTPRLNSRKATPLQMTHLERGNKQAIAKASREDTQYNNKRNSIYNGNKNSQQEDKSYLANSYQMPPALGYTSNDQGYNELNSNDAPNGIGDVNQNEEVYDNNDDDSLSVPVLTEEEKSDLMDSVIRKGVNNADMETSEADPLINQNSENRDDVELKDSETSINQKHVYNADTEPRESESSINQKPVITVEIEPRELETSINQKRVYNADTEPRESESSINQKPVIRAEIEPRELEISINQKRVYNADMEPRESESSINQKPIIRAEIEPRELETSINQKRVYNAELEPRDSESPIHQKRENKADDAPRQTKQILLKGPDGHTAPASEFLSTFEMNKIMSQHLPTSLESFKKQQWQNAAHSKSSLAGVHSPSLSVHSSRRSAQSPMNQVRSANLQMASNTRTEQRVAKSVDHSETTNESGVRLKRDRKRFNLFERCTNNTLQNPPNDDKQKTISRGSTVIDRIKPEDLHFTVLNESVDEESGEQNNTITQIDGKQAELAIQKLQDTGHKAQPSSSSDGG